MAWEKHVVWDNKAQTKALAEELGQLQPEGADGGSTVWDEAEELQKKVKSVRLLFQDYAPIPAQKSLLALQTKNSLWNNLRPPFKPISKNKTTELATKLRDSYGFQF